jgi:flavin reductase (DIM6/NTAB) family NADH-FMN oxidoreductase RutF
MVCDGVYAMEVNAMTTQTRERLISDVMEQFPYGLYIIGSRAPDGEPNGMMADWVMQVSFEPRLVAVAFEKDAHTLENIRADGVFTVNMLAQDADGMHLASKFAQPYYGRKVTGRAGGALAEVHHKLDGVDYSLAPSGCPVLESVTGWLDCAAEDFLEVGDHVLVTGRVTSGGLEREGDVLTSTYTGWTYSG